jgi:hypothetical protein
MNLLILVLCHWYVTLWLSNTVLEYMHEFKKKKKILVCFSPYLPGWFFFFYFQMTQNRRKHYYGLSCWQLVEREFWKMAKFLKWNNLYRLELQMFVNTCVSILSRPCVSWTQGLYWIKESMKFTFCCWAFTSQIYFFFWATQNHPIFQPIEKRVTWKIE